MKGKSQASGQPLSTARGGMRTGALLAAAVGVLALPSAVLAFSTALQTTESASAPLESVDPGASNEALNRAIAMRSLASSQPFPFTPAGTPNRIERAVTVAVRVDPQAAKSIIVRGRPPIAKTEADAVHLRIAPAAFNLGVSRGYQNFAQDLVQQQERRSLAELPDLKKFSLQPGGAEDGKDSRFSPRISIDEKRSLGRAPRTFAGEAGEVDLGGAYRVTNNLNVTAGVRYSQERERLMPLTDGKQDSQAVYVGTQFSF